ncbi:MAG TPA: FecR family protein, partial [Blastocatellia bacterium]|nr:FecR family protein [Blastocatellia bacterium]
MKTKLHLTAAKQLLVSLFVIAGISAAISAQYLISTKAGFVNLVDGKVRIQQSGANADETQKAKQGSQLSDGDRLITEAGAFAELLLSPGSYLRLNENTEVVAANTSLSATRFAITQGSVIVEVGEIDKKTPIEIETPGGVISVAKIGIYRFDVKGEQVSVSVRKGELFLGSREQLVAKTATKVKSKKFVRLSKAGVSEIAKLS